MTLTKSDRTKLIEELKPLLLTKDNREKLIEEMKEVFVTKEELGQALLDNNKYLPSKDEFSKQMSNLLKAVQDKNEEKDVHDLQHENLGKDTTKLKQQVQHLFKTFEIKDPTEVAPAY